jgi:deoxyadenosine/deoxycytidine kinase
MYNSVKWKENYIIYLIAEPDTILKRIIQRGSLEKIRKNWNEYEKDYLVKILSSYNDFLFSQKPKDNVLIINTENMTTDDVLKEIEIIITNISGYSFKKLVKSSMTQMDLARFLQ